MQGFAVVGLCGFQIGFGLFVARSGYVVLVIKVGHAFEFSTFLVSVCFGFLKCSLIVARVNLRNQATLGQKLSAFEIQLADGASHAEREFGGAVRLGNEIKTLKSVLGKLFRSNHMNGKRFCRFLLFGTACRQCQKSK